MDKRVKLCEYSPSIIGALSKTIFERPPDCHINLVWVSRLQAYAWRQTMCMACRSLTESREGNRYAAKVPKL
eukprot:scaffold330165_cov39-Prasinocladus_malaysianus.AAC.2